ncbi:uncharacterized protein LOC132065724 isoform X1 [Lycium ferocissimum]|uniref:uncharacterized protein LOC132065724 isoform X1 n=1 Tax=Lycium ferocissimum TaxID=112874 RepID=UPI0028159916|nr:uncharacterized protein LOC132065724 isoform X1 [Lycium ferocissimum]
MATISTARSTAYLTALTQEIEKKLQRALTSPSLRRNLLQELFADIALEVDDRAKEIILSSEDAITVAEEQTEGPICYYYVLADHFVHVPQNGKPILDLIVQLWSQSFASNIFSLLFHNCSRFNLKILKSSSATHQLWFKELQMYSGLTSKQIQGVSRVSFRSNTTDLISIVEVFGVKYLLEDVALVPERLKKIPLQAQRDLFLFLSRFIFFYNLADRLGSFLSQFPDFPNAFLIGGPADIFVTELSDQLQKLKVEPVLLHYLSQLKVLQGLELRMATSTRLKTCLYSFTSPGAPMYPTRAVRHAAWNALDLLYPVGRYPRHIISLFFRLLYPWYWPSSFWNFIKSCILAIFYSLLRLIFSSWDKVRSRTKEQ